MKLQRPDPGIDAAKSGLHGKAGIFFNAGLFLKGGGFNILDLDPYLLFDAETSMRGTLEAFTLDLDPANPSTLDVITATRSGVATFTDANGVIQSASANTVRVDHTQGAELTPTVFQNVGNTDFSSNWSHYLGNSSVQSETLNGQPILRWTTTGSTAQLKHDINTEEGKNYTYSFFVRSVSNGGGNGFRAWSQNSPINNHSVINLDSNFQKIVVTFSGKVGGGNVSIGLVELGTHTIDNVLEYSTPQVVDGEIEYDFVANTTGSPKFITGPTFGPRVPMILVEPSAINQTKQSEDFNSSEWTHLSVGQGSTPIVTDNFDYSPDGTQNATRLQVALNGGNTVTDHSIIYDVDSSNTVQTISVWMKSNTNEAYNIYLANTYTGTGTDIAQVTPQWQRFSFSHTTSNHTFSIGLRGGIGSSDSADILIWGAQGEAGSVATSYIPTSGSTVTRAADKLQITGTDFSNFYNPSEGTIYFEGVNNSLIDPRLFSISTGQSQDKFRIDLDNGTKMRIALSENGNATVNTSFNFNSNSLFKVALSFKGGDVNASANGVNVLNSTPSSIPSFSQLSIGSNYNGGGNYLLGHIKRFIYWPTHSDNL